MWVFISDIMIIRVSKSSFRKFCSLKIQYIKENFNKPLLFTSARFSKSGTLHYPFTVGENEMVPSWFLKSLVLLLPILVVVR